MSGEVETAYAKINLALHVRERMPDGFHRIETIFAFCEHGDELSIQSDGALSVDVDGPFADQLQSAQSNLVMDAASLLLRKRSETPAGSHEGARISLTKNLPVASGIGGGSADAAAAKVARLIEKRRAESIIPWQMAVVAGFMRCMPRALYDRLFEKAPRKPRGLPT